MIPADLLLKQTEALEKANAAVEAAQTLDDNRRDKSSTQNIDNLKKVEKRRNNRKTTEKVKIEKILRMMELVKINMKQLFHINRPYDKTL